MPLGDPAGYLPNVLKARKRNGQPAYQPRAARGQGRARKAPAAPTAHTGGKPSFTGGAMAPPSLSGKGSRKLFGGYRARKQRSA
jgi:hypothetical protein